MCEDHRSIHPIFHIFSGISFHLPCPKAHEKNEIIFLPKLLFSHSFKNRLPSDPFSSHAIPFTAFHLIQFHRIFYTRLLTVHIHSRIASYPIRLNPASHPVTGTLSRPSTRHYISVDTIPTHNPIPFPLSFR